MVERIRAILNRFPEDEETVRILIRENPKFNALCEENANIAQARQYMDENEMAHLDSETRALKERRTAVEEPFLTRMEGYEAF